MIGDSQSPVKDFCAMKEGFLFAFLSVRNPAPLQRCSKQGELGGKSLFEPVWGWINERIT